MSVLTVNTTMLYCPKCRSTYQEGTQRFCSNDGGRLLPAPSAQKTNPPVINVFTSILAKMPPKEKSAQTPPPPVPVIAPKSDTALIEKIPQVYSPISNIIKAKHEKKPAFSEFDEVDSILELDFDPSMALVKTGLSEPNFVEPPPAPETAAAEPKISPKPIDPNLIPSGTAEVGDRQTHPAGRPALSWKNTDVLIGQMVKGRYFVTEKIREEEDSLIFLAEDKVMEGRKSVLRVFMYADEETLAEDLVSLSHINHPNIAAVFDSGELPEGNKFVVAEFVEGESLETILKHNGQFNTKRTARIIRQVSYALSEAHQNGILHRNLKPENIILTVSEAGIEQVKLINFELSEPVWREADVLYKSPEEIDGETPSFASEIYSLAIIAYQMLTGRMPFDAVSDRELLKAQRTGLTILPTVLRLDMQPLADKILEKALAFDAAGRYPKARDFGDAFFNVLTTVAPWEKDAEEAVAAEPANENKAETRREFFVVPPINPKLTEDFSIESDIHIASTVADRDDESEEISEIKASDDLAWERRSPEPPRTANWQRGILPILGAILLLAGLWGVWKLLSNRSAVVENPGSVETAENAQPKMPYQENLLPRDAEIDRPPDARMLKQPENTARFVNNKENLSGDLAKNFLGFEIFYPQDWKKSDSGTNFLDIAKRNADGFPLEQMLITHYKSRGMMHLDLQNFPKLIEKSNQDLKSIIGDSYKVLGKGEITIQNGRWKAYEVKFEGFLSDKKTRLFGRRIWIPVQRPGEQNGFVITMLATSLSEEIKSVADVGTKGDLATILENFEPEQN